MALTILQLDLYGTHYPTFWDLYEGHRYLCPKILSEDFSIF